MIGRSARVIWVDERHITWRAEYDGGRWSLYHYGPGTHRWTWFGEYLTRLDAIAAAGVR
jgi:hypothetical protein